MIWADKLFYILYITKLKSLDLTDIKLGIWPMYNKHDKIKSAHGIVDCLKKFTRKRKNELIEKICKYLGVSQDENSYATVNNPFVLLSIEDIQKLSLEPLVTIGSHSVSHEILTTLSLKEAEREITLSKHMLELWINKPINHFSYPDGKYNASIKEIVKKAGYKTATRIGLGLFKSNQHFQIPRLAVGAWDNCYTFKAMINAFFSIKVELYNLFAARNL
jgi:peptidoglycan/xylan/chitin deacetylase (PgdA/CDA1 family)